MNSVRCALQMLALILFFSAGSTATEEQTSSEDAKKVMLLQFSSEQQRLRYQKLLWELRCPKCQNQNLVDSDAPLAGDLRREIYQRVVAGESSDTIVNSLESRYGEFVRYAPPLDRYTIVLWLLPLLLVFISAFIVIGISSRNRDNEGYGDD